MFRARRGQRPALLSCLCRSVGVPSAGEPLMPERGGPGQSPAGTPCPAFAPLVACETERPSRPRGAGTEGAGAGRTRGSGARCRAPGSALPAAPWLSHHQQSWKKPQTKTNPQNCILHRGFFQPQRLGMVYTNPLTVTRKRRGGASC